MDISRSNRISGRPGRRFEGLKVLAEAARIEPGTDLRDEAIACMGLVDLRVEHEVELPAGTQNAVLDPALERCAAITAAGEILVLSLADGSVALRLPAPGWASGLKPWLRSFSPDGKFLAAQYGQEVQVWDIAQRSTVLRVPSHGETTFLPDSSAIAVAGKDGAVRLHGLGSGTVTPATSTGGVPRSIAISPVDGRLALCRTGSSQVEVHVPDARVPPVLLSHPQEVFEADWHPDGQLLATACRDGRAYLWDLESPKELQVVFEGHQSAVVNVAFSRDGDLLATSSWDNTTRLWQPLTGRCHLTAPGAVAHFGPGDRRLGFLVKTNRAGVWEVAAAREQRTLAPCARGNSTLWSLDLHPQGRLILTGHQDGGRLWDAETGRQMARLPSGSVLGAMFHPGGRSFFTCGAAGLQRWAIDAPAAGDPGDVRVGPAEALLAAANGWCSISGDGKLLAASSAGELFLLELEPHALRWRVPHANGPNPFLSPNGKWILTSVWGARSLGLIDAATGQRVRDLPAPSATVQFTADSRHVIIGTATGYQLWETATWSLGPTLPKDGLDAAPPVALGGDGSLLVVAPTGKTLQVLELATLRPFVTFETAFSGKIGAVKLSRDGNRLVGGVQIDKDLQGIQVWELGRMRAELERMGIGWKPTQGPAATESGGAR